MTQPRGPLSSAERIGVLENRFSLSMTAHIALSLDDSLRAALARAEQAEAERDGLREVLEDIAMALIDGTPVKNGVIFPVGGEAAKLLAAVDEAHRILLAALKPYTEPSHG